MQITNSAVCGRSKGCIYKQIKPPLVGEHAFPLTGFVCMAAHVTIDYISHPSVSAKIFQCSSKQCEGIFFFCVPMKKAKIVHAVLPTLQ